MSDGIVYITSGTVKKPFRNVNVAANGEPLSPSQLFTSRTSAIINIKSHMRLFSGDKVTIQDDTLNIPNRYILLSTGRTVPLKAGPKYKKKKTVNHYGKKSK